MPSFFERFFGREKPTPGLPAPARGSGLTEFFRPAAPAEPSFEILAPPPQLPAGPGEPEAFGLLVPATPIEPSFEILAPPPPAAPPARRTLTEALVPEQARESQPEPQRPERETLFASLTEPVDPYERERDLRGIMPRDWLERILDLPEILRMTQAGRQDRDFQRAVDATLRRRPPAELPLILIAPEERGAEDKVADFLGIPRIEVEKAEQAGRDPWKTLLNPGLYAIERALDWHLGDQVPGSYRFGVNDQGEFGLVYLEEHPDV